jgi:NADH pyrophosphatase NudC (nudix superfamily)
MCNCISKMEKDLIGTEYHKRKILKAELTSVSLLFSSMKFETTSTIELTLEGIKKITKTNAVHVFCPFCGEKYNPQKNYEPNKQ